MPIPPIIPPLYIIPQGAGICQVFLQKYFKKIKQKSIDFEIQKWYNIYIKKRKRGLKILSKKIKKIVDFRFWVWYNIYIKKRKRRN